jgi:hypothetical protein
VLHEFADDGVVGAGVGDAALQVRALERKVVRVNVLLFYFFAEFRRQFAGLQPMNLETGTGDMDGAVGNQMAVETKGGR